MAMSTATPGRSRVRYLSTIRIGQIYRRKKDGMVIRVKMIHRKDAILDVQAESVPWSPRYMFQVRVYDLKHYWTRVDG